MSFKNINLFTLGIISFLVAIVSINNNIVRAQWVETPPRYSCPTGMNKNKEIRNYFETIMIDLKVIMYNVLIFLFEIDRILYPCNCSGSGDDGVNVKCNNTNIASLSVGLRQVWRKSYSTT